MIKYVLTGIYILCTTLGIYFMKLGGNSFQIGLTGGFSFKMGYITLLGFVFYIVSFLLWQRLLVTFDLSYIVPITTGISQLIILLLGILAFKEKINATGIVGALLIIVGVVLLALGKR